MCLPSLCHIWFLPEGEVGDGKAKCPNADFGKRNLNLLPDPSLSFPDECESMGSSPGAQY